MADYVLCGLAHSYRATQVAQLGIDDPSASVIVIDKDVVRLDICSLALTFYGRLVTHKVYVPRSTCMSHIDPVQVSSAANLQRAGCR